MSFSAPVHNAALIDYCDEGKRWDPVLSAYFYKLDTDTFTLIPLTPPKQQSPRSSSNHTSWFEYKGHWGDFQFPQSDPRQETIPRFGVHRFETGPNGPRFKHLLRKGLVRDQARRLSWTEWAAGIYMYWYPCCIRGWRKWISVGVIITAFAAVVVGIILGVRRLRKPKTVYTKLQAEDIQMDEWRRDEEALLSSSEDEDDRHRR
jgi:amino acid transporter